MIGDAVWPARAVALPPEWSILLFTDGLIEGRTGNGSGRLGDEGLVQLIERARDATASSGAMLRHVVTAAEELNGGPLVDDVAAVLITQRPE